jgi:hypothetical protein
VDASVVTSDVPLVTDLAGLAVLFLLLALPGLLVVRAPLASVPSISLAFWALSGWWTPAFVGRERFLISVLAGSGALALLRLRELVPWPALSKPALVTTAVALLLLVPFFLSRVPRGSEMSFHALAARLVVWNDGVPGTYEPLAAVRPFGAHAPALATLAADVSMLSGLPAYRSVTLLALAAEGLFLVGLFAAYARRLPPFWAAGAAVLGVAIVRLPAVLAPFGEGAPMLALALAGGALAILSRSDSRPAAVAAGFVMGAAIVAHDLLGLLALGGLLLPSVGGRKSALLVPATALVAAAPQLHRLAAAWSMASFEGLLHASPLAGHLIWPAALASLVALPAAADRLRAAPLSRQVIALAAGLATSVVLKYQVGPGIEPPSADVLEWAARQDPTAVLCISPDSSGIWIPAIAGRAVSAPYLPPVYPSSHPLTCTGETTIHGKRTNP